MAPRKYLSATPDFSIVTEGLGNVNELERGWSILKQGIDVVVFIIHSNQDPPAELFINLYNIVFDLCCRKKAQEYHCMKLYERCETTLSDYINHNVLPPLRNEQTVGLLKGFCKAWSYYCKLFRWLCHTFEFLSRHYIKKNLLPTLEQTALRLFRELVYNPIFMVINFSVISMIQRGRIGESFNQALLRDAINIFIAMGLEKMDTYVHHFEEPMMRASNFFYAQIAASHIEEDTCPEYMLMVEHYLNKEEENVIRYMYPMTGKKLLEAIRYELLIKPMKPLLEKEDSGVNALLRDGKVESLKRMYELYSPISEGLDLIISFFKKHITDKGIALVKQGEEAMNRHNYEDTKGPVGQAEQVFIKNLFEIHDEYSAIISSCFRENFQFHKALREAFMIFCNKNIGCMSMAEILSNFADSVLTRGGGYDNLSDEDVEKALDKIVAILKYVDNKDLFAEFYRKKLARRLLIDRSSNNDHERCILLKLKEHNGGYFTSKLEGMLTDFTLAKENQITFQNFRDQCLSENAIDLKMDMNVTVLTSGFWPTYKSCDVYLPAEMARGVELFMTFYEATTTKRRLNWIFSLGTCIVGGYFERAQFEFSVTTYQAALLMLFNHCDRLSFREIKKQLNLPDGDVIRLLHSFSCAKYNILKKNPNTKMISKEDVFEFNSKFTDKMRSIRIPLPLIVEKKKVMETVEMDRRYAIDATLIRIMKGKMVLTHQKLVSECIETLSKLFKPDVRLIKQRIEDLMEREYLERDKDDTNQLKYLA